MSRKIEIETEMINVVIDQGLRGAIEIEDVLDLATVTRDAQDHQKVTETEIGIKTETVTEEIKIVIVTETEIETEKEDTEMTTSLNLEGKIKETVVVKALLRDVEEAKTSASAWYE